MWSFAPPESQPLFLHFSSCHLPGLWFFLHPVLAKPLRGRQGAGNAFSSAFPAVSQGGAKLLKLSPHSGGLGGSGVPLGCVAEAGGHGAGKRGHCRGKRRNTLQPLGICSWDRSMSTPAISSSHPSGSLFLHGSTPKGQGLGKRRCGIAL